MKRKIKPVNRIFNLKAIIMLLLIVCILFSPKEENTLALDSFNLTSKVNLNAANGKGGVDLSWSNISTTNKTFRVYQKKEGSDEWQTISTMDFTKIMDPVKVLNVYPVATDSYIPYVTFKYKDGTTVTMKKSAALKAWMEGGTMIQNGVETTFEAYGRNPYTGQQLLEITPVTSTDFNNDPNMIWNYDVVMFGTWDTNGDREDQPNAAALNVIEQYIKSGYGVLCGHDTIGFTYPNIGLSNLRKYFNVETGYWDNGYQTIEGTDYKDSWGFLSIYVKVKRQGLLTNFPWELPLGTILTIPAAHTCANAAKGDTWMDFTDNPDKGYYGYYWGANTDTSTNYYSYGTGDAYYYLTTYNNTAMIQTGHSNCESTEDERKVLANTLFYLKQRTEGTSATDNSAQDLAAPNAPNIDIVTGLDNAIVSSNDNGTKYSFYVEAYDRADYQTVVARSNTTSEIVTTGVKGYYYIVDGNSTNDFDVSNANFVQDTNIPLNSSYNGKYLHVKAIDYAGNVSKVSDALIQYGNTGSLTKTAKWVDSNNAIAEITLNAQFSKDESSKPLDIVIVQDVSGSMASVVDGKTRTQWSKEALTEFANKIYNTAPDTRLSLVTFGASAVNTSNTYISCGLTDVNNKSTILNAINNLHSKGWSTDFSAGLKKAIEVISSQSNKDNREICVIFVTDGEPWGGKGLDEARTLKQEYNAKIYGIGINISSQSSINNIINICEKSNYLAIKSAGDYSNVYNTVLKSIVSYTNKDITCTDAISNYFNLVSVESDSGTIAINGNDVIWSVGTMRTGSTSIRIRAQLKDEYRYSENNIDAKYETNNNAILTYNMTELISGKTKNEVSTAASPELNYHYEPEKITLKILENNSSHGTEYFGLFTDTSSTKTSIVQSINYATENSTTFSVKPQDYYLYMVDKNGNKLQDSHFWYYQVESTVGDISAITDGYKIINHPNCTITQTADNIRPANVTNDILTMINSTNEINLKRYWLTIAGKVWNDQNKNGKTDAENGMKGITVILHMQTPSGEQTLTKETDESGSYSFGGVDIANTNYVEFKYNGMYYEPTRYKTETASWEESSKAVEDINTRKSFNEKYAVVTPTSNTYTRKILEEKQIIDRYGNLEQNSNQSMTNFVDNCTISAYTGYNQNDRFYQDLYVTKNTMSDLGYSNYDFTQYINLGLVDREEADIAINQDITNVTLTINEDSEKYEYSKRKNVYELSDRAGSYYNSGYTRELYLEDYFYEGDNSLEAYITYKIGIKNNSTDISMVPTEIVNYYNSDYTLDTYEVQDVNGNIYKDMLNFNTKSEYGATNTNINGYNKIYITSKQQIMLEPNAEMNIFITYKLNKNRDNKLLIDNSKTNIVEITCYETYYANTAFIPNKGNNRTQQEFSNGVKAGIVDIDSVPGNLNLSEVTNLNDQSELNNILNDTENKYNLEDDSDIAPAIKFTYTSNNGDITRKISGNVWEEDRNKTERLSKIGDGQYAENTEGNKEGTIKGVEVQLIDIKATQAQNKEVIAKIYKNGEWTEAKTTTGDDGYYEFDGYIPSAYVVKFTYGVNTDSKNEKGKDIIKYNGQDYKSTLYYTPSSPENNNTEWKSDDPDADYYQYNLKQSDEDSKTNTRKSDARDIMSNNSISGIENAYYNSQTTGNRQYVNNYCNNNGDGLTNEIAQKLEDTTNETYMTAKSGLILANIEYNRTESKTSETGSNNVGEGNYDYSSHYSIDYLDLG